MGRVSGKIAWITGSGLGLGCAAALLLAAEGARVVVTDVDRSSGEVAVRRILSTGGDALFCPLDVTDPDQWKHASRFVEMNCGRLDIMVNNAGIAIAANIETTSLADWRRTMAVNADGVFLGCQHAVARMKNSQAGSIINISSIDAMIGEADAAAYCASKGAVRALSKAVAVHCAEHKYGIRCNSIHPGYVWTPQTEKFLGDVGLPDQEKAKALKRHPIGFLGEPRDIAYMVLYLASDESRFVTGSEMVVDGGYLMV